MVHGLLRVLNRRLAIFNNRLEGLFGVPFPIGRCNCLRDHTVTGSGASVLFVGDNSVVGEFKENETPIPSDIVMDFKYPSRVRWTSVTRRLDNWDVVLFRSVEEDISGRLVLSYGDIEQMEFPDPDNPGMTITRDVATVFVRVDFLRPIAMSEAEQVPILGFEIVGNQRTLV